jgi:arylsulfatase A-like enzyme
MRILFLDLDTLRPDHLGCYGYHRNTSPNIDSIARDGVIFENYHCSDAPCLPARAALTSGRFGIHNGAVGHGGTAADMKLDGAKRGFRDRLDKESFANIFRHAGLRTVSISPFSERHSSYWFNYGYNEVYNTGSGGMESAEEVSPVALDWIARNAEKDDWFLHINYWDPHTPYRAPADFGNPFENDPPPSWMTQETLDKHRKMVGPHKIREISMFDNVENPKYPRQPGELHDINDWKRFIDGYDCGIKYMDDHIGELFNALNKAGVLEDLIIIISSDHGENMGELGIYAEHATADRITTRIPMIIKWPDSIKGHVDKGLHYNLDLLPTLAELLNIPIQPKWDGKSYKDAFVGEDCGRDYLVVSQCAHVCQRGVRFDNWHYIRTYHDGYHLFPNEMLFDVENDPHEEYDLASERPDICSEAASKLLKWHDEAMASMNYAEDPMNTVMREGGPLHARGNLKQYIDYLKKTGREYAIDELIRRHPNEIV